MYACVNIFPFLLLPSPVFFLSEQPKHEGEGGGKKKRRRFLEGSTGSDKVSSFVRPVKRTFSLSRKPRPHKPVYGSTQSLNTDPGYRTMPSYAGERQGLPHRTSPSFHSVHNSKHPSHRGSNHHHNQVVLRSQSMRHRTRKRPKLYSLASMTASLYLEQDIDIVPLPDTTLEASTRYEYNDTRPQKKYSSSIRRSQSFQKNKSKSPVPGVSTNSVLDSLHMYTVAEELAKLESLPFGLLSKHHLEHLDLGSAGFDTCLAIEPPRKEHTSFRTPIGMKQRPVSSLDMQLVAMRNDGVGGASRASNVRPKHLSAADVPTASSSREDHDSFPPVSSNGPLFGIGGVVIRRRISMTGPNSIPRPVSASFVDPPTVKKMVAASRMSLQPHGGSLTDITRPDSPAQEDESPTTPKIRPKRPAPQAPGVSRPLSRTSTPDSGGSTPKGFRTQSPLVGYQLSLPNISPSPPQSNREKPSNITSLNGRVTPTGSQIINNHFPSGPALDQQHCTNISSPPKMLALKRNISTPQLPSPPQLLPVIHRNTSSPQLPMIPILEEDTPIAHHTAAITPSSPRVITPSFPQNITPFSLQVITPFSLQVITPSSPPVRMNGHAPAPPPFLRRDSLYVSPRKQSLTLTSVDKKRRRASQILETGGLFGGDLSGSRRDLLEAIRKGLQLKQVEKKEREREDFVSMPWDVAAILERRLALELDSDTSEEEESNDTEWDDED